MARGLQQVPFSISASKSSIFHPNKSSIFHPSSESFISIFHLKKKFTFPFSISTRNSRFHFPSQQEFHFHFPSQQEFHFPSYHLCCSGVESKVRELPGSHPLPRSNCRRVDCLAENLPQVTFKLQVIQTRVKL